MLDYKPVDSLMELNSKLMPNQEELYENPKKYRILMGKLNYVTINRPSISFVVGVVGQFMHTPCV